MKKKTVQVRLDEDDKKELQKRAQDRGHTVSSLIRFLVKKFLE